MNGCNLNPKGRPQLSQHLTRRSWMGTVGIALIAVLMFSLLAACGSDDDGDDSDPTAAATTATGSTGGGASTTEADTTPADTSDMTPAGDMGDAMAIGLCLQQSTTGDIVTDLRDGNTESAEDMYRDCLGSALPESLVSQLDPIIEQAGTCGTEASADLTDDDIAAIEDGDQATIGQITNDTLECLSAELGVDLQ